MTTLEDVTKKRAEPSAEAAAAAELVGESRVTLVEGNFCDQDLNSQLLLDHRVQAIVHQMALHGARYAPPLAVAAGQLTTTEVEVMFNWR